MLHDILNRGLQSKIKWIHNLSYQLSALMYPSYVEEQLTHPHPENRVRILRSLARISKEQLERAMQDTSVSVRRAAILRPNYWPSKETVELGLQDEDEYMREIWKEKKAQLDRLALQAQLSLAPR